MSDLRDAARQALEALEGGGDSWRLIWPAIDALRAALAEPNRAQKMRDAGYTRRPTLREMAALEQPVADRAAFERHVESLGYSVARSVGGYWSSHTHLMWETWQAALEQPYAEQARRVEQETHGRMRIDPVTGDVSIGTPTEPEQEPVAWMWDQQARRSSTGIGGWDKQLLFCRPAEDPFVPKRNITPLYTHPPRRKPLSDEELDRLWREPMSADWEHREYARAVEAAHGIKENT